jgi:hypothetical protein
MLGKSTHNYSKLKGLMENDIMNRFPNIARHISAINIDKSSEVPLSADIRSAGLFINVDSNKCTKEAMPYGSQQVPAIREYISDALKNYIDKSMDSLMKNGMSEADAKKKVTDSIVPMMGYDPAKKQYVISGAVPQKDGKVTDSLLEQTSIPMWNVGWLNKVIKQPFATSHAKNLVSVESFGNPWADVIGLFKESFEGYGKLSSVARGNVKQNNSNPVTNEASQIVDEVFNISVDYESDVMEDIKAKQAGNFLTSQIKADREKYAMMVLDRMQDALIYYGSDEAGIDGLIDVADVEIYTGIPLYDVFNGTSVTKGATIVMAMNKLIGDFLRENHYMARKVVINVSEYVFQALTQTVYSDVYNPASPLKVLTGNFKGRSELDGGLVQCEYSIVSDTMLNPNTPFNPTGYDMLFMTVPSISDALTGTQDSLVIHPELLKSYMVPALWQRSGLLYTMYKRIGGVIAPVEGTVKVVQGFGYQG